MKLRNKLGILLLTLMTAQLVSGCRLIVPSDKPLVAPNFEGGRYGSPEDWANGGYDSSSDPPGLTPDDTTGNAAAAWDVDHALDMQFSPAQGLELPVEGATGYTSVELYLWRDEPAGDWCKLANIRSRSYTAPTPDSNQGATDAGATDGTTTPNWGGGATPNGSGTQWSQPDAPQTGGWAAPQAARGSAMEQPLPAVRALNAAPAQDGGAQVQLLSSASPVAVMKMKPGTAFLILKEQGDWWYVRAENQVGWVEHRYCLINLPDVIPSMLYDDTNSYSSVFRSSGKDIPNITERALYNARAYNPRLGRDEFLMPVLYTMARKICLAQQHALAEGNCIVLYEGYRPFETQMSVVNNVRALANQDSVVRAGISTPPWNISWFIATGISNHQQGYAMDVSLAKVTEAHIDSIDGHSFVQIDNYELYTMPTPIHELSMAACTYTAPVAIFSTTAWQSGTMSPEMAANEPAKALQRYCTTADMTPLASEWWHFNDLNAYNMTTACHSKGDYYIEDCKSLVPSLVAY